MNTFFIAGTLSICAVIQYFNEDLRRKEITAQMDLNKEIKIRGTIIERKTKEAIRLKQLSAQFSPQVVAAIHNGDLTIDQNLKNEKICIVFLDIVNSTEKVVNRSADDIHLTLESFLKTTISIFLKYDLTIDKFQGDGILAFSNSPIQYADFIDRVCLAVLEVIQQFEKDREPFLRCWGGPLQVRAGTAVGFSNVGFFGDKKNFRTFTAIGRPLPFASGLSAGAGENQILTDQEAALALSQDNFSIKSIGSMRLKEFNNEQIEVFELLGANKAAFHQDFNLENF